MVTVQARAGGGAVNDVPSDATTAYAHRHQNPTYLTFETDTSPQRLHDALPGATLTRLRNFVISRE